MKPAGILAIWCLAAALAGVVFVPWLLPMALPLVFLLRRYVNARQTMTNALSQLTQEFAGSLGMTKALDDF
jgi:hypothetical protein